MNKAKTKQLEMKIEDGIKLVIAANKFMSDVVEAGQAISTAKDSFLEIQSALDALDRHRKQQSILIVKQLTLGLTYSEKQRLDA
jgi:hypothetical protein